MARARTILLTAELRSGSSCTGLSVIIGPSVVPGGIVLHEESDTTVNIIRHTGICLTVWKEN